MLCSNFAARGLDFCNVTHVILVNLLSRYALVFTYIIIWSIVFQYPFLLLSLLLLLLLIYITIILLSCQVNLPSNADDYIHTAGRTGRLNKPGDVISIISPGETFVMKRFANSMGISVSYINNNSSEVLVWSLKVRLLVAINNK